MPCHLKRCDSQGTCENKNDECKCKDGFMFDDKKDDCLGELSIFPFGDIYNITSYVPFIPICFGRSQILILFQLLE